MAIGKVKWFDNKSGFGFIIQETGKDIFVHHTQINGKGFKTLNEGEEVSFEIIESEKGLKAQNVERLNPPMGAFPPPSHVAQPRPQARL